MRSAPMKQIDRDPEFQTHILTALKECLREKRGPLLLLIDPSGTTQRISCPDKTQDMIPR